MSLIIPANTLASGGFSVDNSCRFDDGSSAYMHKTPGGAGNRQKFTFSCWVKKTSGGTEELLSVGGSTYTRIGFEAGDEIKIFHVASGSTAWEIQTVAKYRDPSAWYNFVFAFDTTQGTASNRIKLYVNGVRVEPSSGFGDETYPDQNYTTEVNNAVKHRVGIANNDSSAPFDGYMSEVVLIDGQQLAPTEFGEFDEDNGIWKPIDVSGLTAGTNGFYLDFEASGNLGNDVFGGTDLTAVNLSATDQTTDTCTNNFATLNPLHSIGASSELSQGNLEYDPSGHHRIISTIAPSSGKWYAEVKGIDNPDKFNAGVCYYPIPANGSASSFAFGQGVNADVGRWSNDFGIKANGDYGNNNSYSSYMASLEGENNNIVGIYMDLDNYKLYFSKNGSLVSSTGKDLTNNGEPYGFISVGEAATFQWNFGNPSFAISSGNTDGEYGNFEYSTTITGDGASKTFKALCTKNLAEYG